MKLGINALLLSIRRSTLEESLLRVCDYDQHMQLLQYLYHVGNKSEMEKLENKFVSGIWP